MGAGWAPKYKNTYMSLLKTEECRGLLMPRAALVQPFSMDGAKLFQNTDWGLWVFGGSVTDHVSLDFYTRRVSLHTRYDFTPSQFLSTQDMVTLDITVPRPFLHVYDYIL